MFRINPYAHLRIDEMVEDEFQKFRADLFDKRCTLQRKLQTLQSKSPECATLLTGKADCDVSESALGVRRFAIMECVSILTNTLDTFAMYERVVNARNQARLCEFINLLFHYAETSFARTISAENRALWTQTFHNMTAKYSGLDKWLTEYHKAIKNVVYGVVGASAILIGIHLAPFIPLGGLSILMPAGVGIAISLIICMVRFQRRRARRAAMARFTYESLKDMKEAAQDLNVLDETLARLKRSCDASYQQWRAVMPLNPECNICLVEIEPDELLAKPLCENDHPVVFHRACLERWQQERQDCPWCHKHCLLQEGKFE